MSAPDDDNLEARLRAFAEEIGGSIQRAVEELDLSQLTDQIEELKGSLEHVAEQLDTEHLSEQFELNEDRAKELAGLAAQWLSRQFGGGAGPGSSPWAPRRAEPDHDDVYEEAPSADELDRIFDETPRVQPSPSSQRRGGPHPLDLPTEQQGLALSALESRRWKVDPGTNELIEIGGGPSPAQPVGLVSELRARDWITPGGEVTLVGRDALGRWVGQSHPS